MLVGLLYLLEGSDTDIIPLRVRVGARLVRSRNLEGSPAAQDRMRTRSLVMASHDYACRCNAGFPALLGSAQLGALALQTVA